MCKKIYFIDIENVGASWTKLVKSSNQKDEFWLFDSKDNVQMNYELLSTISKNNTRIMFEKTYTGKNALDFQLVLTLALNINKSDQFYIISNDTGYDAPIKKLSDKGYHVQRGNVEGILNMPKTKVEQPVPIITAEQKVKQKKIANPYYNLKGDQQQIFFSQIGSSLNSKPKINKGKKKAIREIIIATPYCEGLGKKIDKHINNKPRTKKLLEKLGIVDSTF